MGETGLIYKSTPSTISVYRMASWKHHYKCHPVYQASPHLRVRGGGGGVGGEGSVNACPDGLGQTFC